MTVEGIVLEVPDLATETIRLRRWRDGDAASLARAWLDAAIIAGSMPPSDRSESGARRWIQGCDERRLAGVAFDLVIAGVVDDQVLGEVGFSRFDANRRAALMGWWVHEEARGAGVATAAVSLLADWALADGGLADVLAEIAAENTASEAVARAAGFSLLAHAVENRAAVWRRSNRA